MEIHLKQDIIEKAIRGYITSTGFDLRNKQVTMAFTNGRGANGISVTLDVADIDIPGDDQHEQKAFPTILPSLTETKKADPVILPGGGTLPANPPIATAVVTEALVGIMNLDTAQPVAVAAEPEPEAPAPQEEAVTEPATLAEVAEAGLLVPAVAAALHEAPAEPVAEAKVATESLFAAPVAKAQAEVVEAAPVAEAAPVKANSLFGS